LGKDEWDQYPTDHLQVAWSIVSILMCADVFSVRPHMEAEGMGAWNVNVSTSKDQVAIWWILSNEESNIEKVSEFIGSSITSPMALPIHSC
jgi:hypothetical protein